MSCSSSTVLIHGSKLRRETGVAEAALSSPDILQQVFGYLHAPALTSVRAVRRDWMKLADDSLAWPELCRELWQDKQNMPLEQWVRCPSGASPEDTTRHQIEYLLLFRET